jgi:predicted nucleic acid-binding protein
VSAIKFRGQPLEIVQMGVEGKVDIAISQSIIDETLRVLRLKFKTTEAELDATSRIMHSCGRMVRVDQHFDAVPADPKDEHIVDWLQMPDAIINAELRTEQSNRRSRETSNLRIRRRSETHRD